MMEKIRQNRLDRAFFQYQDEFEKKALEVLRSGWYLLGRETAEFEKEFASFIGVKHCIGVANGTDALWISLKVLGIGENDEVIVPANTFIADVMVVVRSGAKPVFAEPDEYFCISPADLKKRITPKTKAVIPVHLYGQSCDMEATLRIAQECGIKVIEDCAQGHGATYKGRAAGSFGDISCFSFYPAKNLGAFGDGGAILTNSDEIAAAVREFRYYGSRERYRYDTVGTNSRLDELQAGLLRVRLSHFDETLAERRYITDRYLQEIKNENILLPCVRENAGHAWHQFVVRCDRRDALAAYLADNGIETLIHYPVPAHLAKGYAFLNVKKGSLPVTERYADTVLSLPLYNGMAAAEINRVIQTVNDFK